MDKATSDNTLNNIFNSSHFSSEIDQKLLRYLADNSLTGKTLKEADIARDIFGRDDDFDPLESSIVRAHMHSIRKKLETYYLMEGKNDKIRLSLPKGHYKIKFIDNSEKKIQKPHKWKPIYYFVIISLLFLGIAIYFWQRDLSLVKETESLYLVDKDNPIWTDFLNSSLPTILVIGDYYVYQRPHKLNNSELFIRNVEINSDSDFEKFLDKNPDAKAKYIHTPLTYLGMEVPSVVFILTKVFRGNETKIKIKLASDLDWQDIQKNNIIFVGSDKTLRFMKSYLNQLYFKVHLFPHKIYYTPNNKDTVQTYSLESYYRYGFHDDYPIIAKFHTTDQTTIMLIVSFSSFGKTEALKAITSPSFVENLQQKNFIKGKIPPYFEILFKVHGIQRTGFNTSILHFNQITKKIIGKNNQ